MNTAESGGSGNGLERSRRVGAGVAGTAVMTAIMYMMGATMRRSTMPVYVMGALMHFGLGIMFGLAHTALYSAFELESGLVVWGILFGLAHWMIAGTGMGMLGNTHPRMRTGEVFAPGLFLRNFPQMTVL